MSTHAPLELHVCHSPVQSALLRHLPHVLLTVSQRGVVRGHWVLCAHSTHSPFAALQYGVLVVDVQCVFDVHWTQTPRESQIGVVAGQRNPLRHVSMQ